MSTKFHNAGCGDVFFFLKKYLCHKSSKLSFRLNAASNDTFFLVKYGKISSLYHLTTY